MSRTWQNGLFSCFSDLADCFIGCCAPCVTFGETDYRLHNESDTQASGASFVDSACILFYALACPTCGVYPCLKASSQRSDIRTRAGIPGSSGADMAAAYCCTCCVVIQNKHEVVDMQMNRGQYAGGVGGVAAAGMGGAVQPGTQGGMSYEKGGVGVV